MTASRFAAWRDPDSRRIEQVGALQPTNPLATPQYAQARARAGEVPWLLALVEGEEPRTGCLGFVTGGGAYLEIPSVPPVRSDSAFWDGLWALARSERFGSLQLGSFASTDAHLPDWPGCLQRAARTEWVLELGADAKRGKLSSDYRRLARHARDAGLTLRVSREVSDLESHLLCVGSSMERRSARGEAVPESETGDLQRHLLSTGAAELAQATLDGEVLSSAVVLRSERGAYYQSAGTNEAGRAMSASKFLVLELVEDLTARGVRLFNLGGAQADNPGLQSYKRRFGARPVELEAGLFSTVHPSLRKLWSLGRRARGILRVGG